jgi:hypothetical protein
MKRFSYLVTAVFLFAAAVSAQQTAPVPPALLGAQQIFLSNAGTPLWNLSGGPNRAYNDFYAALKSEGRFALAGDPSQADLVLTLLPADPFQLKLTIVDRKSQFLLWTLFQPIQVCALQKTCDKNFDAGIDSLVKQFVQLTGKAPAPAP